MNNLKHMLKIFVMVFASLSIFGVNAYAAENEGTAVYDESVYTKQVEKSMDKMHMLYMRAFDKSLTKSEANKAKTEYYKIAQGLVREMHERVMGLNVKAGAALSHTDVLLSTHMTMMLLDMLAAEQLEKQK